MKNFTPTRTKNSYEVPVLTICELAIESGIAASGEEDYILGGGGVYTDTDIINNGEY